MFNVNYFLDKKKQVITCMLLTLSFCNVSILH